MKLTPLKCAFGVSVGWFLGFMVTQRGIEENPAQLEAILDSPAPVQEMGTIADRMVGCPRAVHFSVHRPFKTILCYP